MYMARLFFAIALPEPIQQETILYMHELKKEFAALNLRWTKPVNLHITVRFLGETPTEKIMPLTMSLAEKLKNHQTFQIELTSIQPFPWHYSHLLIRAATLSKELASVFYTIDETCRNQGFAPEIHPFIPHITLARSQNQLKIDSHQLPKIGTSSFRVKNIILFESKNTASGTIYHPLKEFNL